MITVLLAIAVFGAAVVLDWCATRYFQAVERGDGHWAGIWSILWAGAGLVGVLVAVEVSKWLLIFEAVGLYLGTRLAVHYAPGKIKQRDIPSRSPQDG